MPDTCCVGGCPNVGTHGGVIRYYTLPQIIKNRGDEIGQLSGVRRQQWIANLRIKRPEWEPHKSSKVCSFHFISGRKADLTDVSNPDWVPTLRMGLKDDEDIQVQRSPTHQRWEQARRSLGLADDETLAKYFLDLFEARRLPKQVETTNADSADKPMASSHKEMSSTQPCLPHAGTSDIIDTSFSEKDNLLLLNANNANEDSESVLKISSSQDMPSVIQNCAKEDIVEIPVTKPMTQSVVNSSNEDTESKDKVPILQQAKLSPSKTPSAVARGIDSIPFTQQTSQSDSNAGMVTKGVPTVSYTIKQNNPSLSDLSSVSVVPGSVVYGPFATQTSHQSQGSNTNQGAGDNKIPSQQQQQKLLRPKPLGADGDAEDSANVALTQQTGSQVSKDVLTSSPISNMTMSRAFMNKLNNAVIIKNSLLRPVYYTCSCGKRLTNTELLEKHKLKVHGEVDQYKCKQCCITYKTQMGLTKHVARDHQGPPFFCSHCNDCFHEVHLLIEHQTKHMEDTKHLLCDLCGRNFHDTNTLLKHKQDVHIKTEEGTAGGFKCCKCGQVYKSKCALCKHESISCNNNRKGLPFSCLGCKEKFQDSLALVQHLKVHDGAKEERDEEETDTKISTCGCGKRFISAKALGRHQCIERLKCPHCDKTFKHPFNLKQHIAIKHAKDKPQFICKSCGRVYNRMQSLTIHEKSHDINRKRWPCNLCPKVYMGKQSLKEHQRKHTGMLLLCSYCGKGYDNLTILRRHEKIHTNNRRYRCVLCHKAYYDSYNLKCHMNTHTGEKPLKCKFCNKRFIYHSARNLHQRTQHGAKIGIKKGGCRKPSNLISS